MLPPPDREKMFRQVPFPGGDNDQLFFPHVGSGDWPVTARNLGLRRLAEYVEFLIWSQETLLARKVLDLLPASLEDLPAIAPLRAVVESKLAHLKSFDAYKAFYDKETERTPDIGHDFAIVDYVERNKRAVAWAAALPPFDGGPVEVLVIGGQTGYLEAALLAANARITVTACEIADAMQPSLRGLIERFPGRVKVHQVKDSVTDWPAGPFDAIFCYEVLEHVPDEDEALFALSHMLKLTGELWASTPNQPISPRFASPEEPGDHVRAFTATRMANLLRRHGLTGEVETTEGNTNLLARVRLRTEH